MDYVTKHIDIFSLIESYNCEREETSLDLDWMCTVKSYHKPFFFVCPIVSSLFASFCFHNCSPVYFPGYPATGCQAESDWGHLLHTRPVHGAGYKVSEGRASRGSQRGVQWAVQQLHPLPQSTETRRGQVHCLTSQTLITFRLASTNTSPLTFSYM